MAVAFGGSLWGRPERAEGGLGRKVVAVKREGARGGEGPRRCLVACLANNPCRAGSAGQLHTHTRPISSVGEPTCWQKDRTRRECCWAVEKSETSFFVTGLATVVISVSWEEETPPDFSTWSSERLLAGVNIERLAGSFDSLEVGEAAARQQEKEFRPRGYRWAPCFFQRISKIKFKRQKVL